VHNLDSLLSDFSNENYFYELLEFQANGPSILHRLILDPTVREALGAAGYQKQVSQYLESVHEFAKNVIEATMKGDANAFYKFTS
jgi:hypothetical protein